MFDRAPDGADIMCVPVIFPARSSTLLRSDCANLEDEPAAKCADGDEIAETDQMKIALGRSGYFNHRLFREANSFKCHNFVPGVLHTQSNSSGLCMISLADVSRMGRADAVSNPAASIPNNTPPAAGGAVK